MLKIAIPFAALIICILGAGEFTVLHHPASVVFKGKERLDLSAVKDVLSVAAGFSQESTYSWSGMYLTDPFSLAKSIALVQVDGISNLNIPKGYTVALNTDGSESDVFEVIQKRIKDRNPNSDSKLVRIDLSNGIAEISEYPFSSGIKNIEVKKSTSYSFLKATNEEDREFLHQLGLLKAIASEAGKNLQQGTFVPDVFWFKFGALHALADVYGENSTTVKEAKQLLKEVIYDLSASFEKAYEGSVLVSVITNDAVHTRRTRAVNQADAQQQGKFDALNLAETYSTNYPVIFNIMLWFTVVMFFSLLAISIAIGTMDPGHDSIIYRSTRMKKDN